MAEKDNKYKTASKYAGKDTRGDMFSGMEEDELKKRLQNFSSKGMKYYDLIKDAIEEIDPTIPIALIYSIMQTESNFDPKVVSSVGAKGLMQFLPSNYDPPKGASRRYAHDPFNPQENIKAGVKFISNLLDGKAGKVPSGDISKALYGYNAGQNRDSLATKSFDDLQIGGAKGYANKILRNYEIMISGEAPDEPDEEPRKDLKTALIGDSNGISFDSAYTKKYPNSKGLSRGGWGAQNLLKTLQIW